LRREDYRPQRQVQQRGELDALVIRARGEVGATRYHDATAPARPHHFDALRDQH